MVQVYKILRQDEWMAAQATGVFRGSSDDLRDGFIHFSAGPQLLGTAEKYFAGERNLVLLAVDDAAMGETMRWEVSRGGQKFPHLYGDLPLDRALWARPILREANGGFVFPSDAV